MERAGKAAAEAIWRYAGPLPALVLCGPGNNGGDGYVIARELARARRRRAGRGSGRAEERRRRARRGERWDGPVETLAEAAAGAAAGRRLVRHRPRPAARRAVVAAPARPRRRSATVRVAIDLPSGVATDDGAILSPVPDFDLTITFQTLKPSHLLQPAARHMGRIVVADIGIEAASRLTRDRPAARCARPAPTTTNISARLCRRARRRDARRERARRRRGAARAGAGYVRLHRRRDRSPACRSAIVQGPGDPLDRARRRADRRASLLGPGLRPRRGGASACSTLALASGRPLVLDADALRLLAEARMLRGCAAPILTPHEGEFARLCSALAGQQGRAGPRRRRAKRRGRSSTRAPTRWSPRPTAAPRSRRRRRPGWRAPARATCWPASSPRCAPAARRPFEAACAGVWLHGRAAELAGPGLIADDLLATSRRCRRLPVRRSSASPRAATA